jgi:hypothetical protein
MPHQSVFTFTTAVDPVRLAELTAVLDRIQSDLDRSLDHNPLLRFGDLGVVHFASLNLFPPDSVHDDYPCSGLPVEERRRDTYLIWENNIDGRIEPYVDALLRNFGEGVFAILRCCRDAPSSADPAALRKYLLGHIVKPGAYHVGAPWRVVQQIRDEATLREAIEKIADTIAGNGLTPVDPVAARKTIQDGVRSDKTLAFALKPAPRVTLWDRIGPWLPLLPRLPMFVVNALLTILMLPYLRWRELRDCEWKGDVDPRLQEQLGARENFIAQNHMANMSDVKPGFARAVSAKALLMIAGINARASTKGKLAGIPSIHFAHWALLDGGKRLLFCSNFDGSWENYLDDFIDKATKGLTGIWGGTIGFPRPRWLLLDGAANGTRFKAIARNKQVPAKVWYSAYKNLTVQAIENNAAIRRDLFTPLDLEGTKNWLRRL